MSVELTFDKRGMPSVTSLESLLDELKLIQDDSECDAHRAIDLWAKRQGPMSRTGFFLKREDSALRTLVLGHLLDDDRIIADGEKGLYAETVGMVWSTGIFDSYMITPNMRFSFKDEFSVRECARKLVALGKGKAYRLKTLKGCVSLIKDAMNQAMHDLWIEARGAL